MTCKSPGCLVIFILYVLLDYDTDIITKCTSHSVPNTTEYNNDTAFLCMTIND